MGTAFDELEDNFPEQMDAAADFLSHYGVKGMKWGHSKSGATTSSKSGKVKEAASEDAARVGGIHTRVKSQKSTKMLSNKELQDAISRMNLEQQYSKMSGGLDKTRRQKASAFISELVTGATKQTVQQIATTELKTHVQNQVNNMKTKPA